jgi:hypothetical protein
MAKYAQTTHVSSEAGHAEVKGHQQPKPDGAEGFGQPPGGVSCGH